MCYFWVVLDWLEISQSWHVCDIRMSTILTFVVLISIIVDGKILELLNRVHCNITQANTFYELPLALLFSAGGRHLFTLKAQNFSGSKPTAFCGCSTSVFLTLSKTFCLLSWQTTYWCFDVLCYGLVALQTVFFSIFSQIGNKTDLSFMNDMLHISALRVCGFRI